MLIDTGSMKTGNVGSSDLRGRLFELVSTDILEVDSGFNEQSNLFDAGLDSIAIMQLLILVEQNFGVRLPAEKITRDNFSSVADLANLIEMEVSAG